MKFSSLIASPGEWMRTDGPHHDIVISSRVRLARNLRDLPFPGWAKKADRIAILEQLKPQVESLGEMDDAFTEYLQDLSALEKQVLVERHLISREHAAKGIGSAVVMNRQQTLSIMINEEDHLRMQAIRCGFQLKNAYKLANKADNALEDTLEFAYSPQLGYLDRLPDQRRHRDARVRDDAPARARPEREHQPGHPGREQDRPGGARPVR